MAPSAPQIRQRHVRIMLRVSITKVDPAIVPRTKVDTTAK